MSGGKRIVSRSRLSGKHYEQDHCHAGDHRRVGAIPTAAEAPLFSPYDQNVMLGMSLGATLALVPGANDTPDKTLLSHVDGTAFGYRLQANKPAMSCAHTMISQDKRLGTVCATITWSNLKIIKQD
jgi:hypothetical protein